MGDSDYFSSFNFDPVNTGASRINRVKTPVENTTQIQKLDSFMETMKISKNEHIYFKLDVEGMKTEAIKGAYDFIMYYPNLTLRVEEKHSGQLPIQDTLSDIALFEFGKVDELNIYAKKIINF